MESLDREVESLDREVEYGVTGYGVWIRRDWIGRLNLERLDREVEYEVIG